MKYWNFQWVAIITDSMLGIVQANSVSSIPPIRKKHMYIKTPIFKMVASISPLHITEYTYLQPTGSKIMTSKLIFLIKMLGIPCKYCKESALGLVMRSLL